jgi:ribosomal protein L35AE/L33A
MHDSFYLGKKVAFVYRGQKEIRGTKIRVIWGKVTRPHGKLHSTRFAVKEGTS